MKRTIFLLMSALALLWLALAPTPPAAPVATPSAADRRVTRPAPAPSLASRRLPDDSIARADVVDQLTRAPDDLVLLRELIAHDPDSRVRERAIFALADALGTDALPELREIALSDPDEVVMTAAQASVHRIRNEHPAPARARIDVSMPETFAPGTPIDVVIRCSVEEYAPKARFALLLPDEVELLDGALEWRGPLAAGQVHEHHLRIRTSGPVLLRARFSADFPESLDVETVQLRIAVGDGTLDASTQLARN